MLNLLLMLLHVTTDLRGKLKRISLRGLSHRSSIVFGCALGGKKTVYNQREKSLDFGVVWISISQHQYIET